jgi:murein DD-endopeptidase MepM/ murein hydrolase activator NlpD
MSAALVVGLAILVVAPLPGSGESRQEILGISVTASSPGSERAAAAAIASPVGGDLAVVGSVGDIRATPDPSGQAAVPDTRFPTPAASLTGYRWPIHNARLTLPFGPSPWGSRIVDGRRFHDGIDVATFCGDRITAAHDGLVLAAGRHYDAFVGWRGDLAAYTARLNEKNLWGTLPIAVVTDDGNGYRSIYAHFWKVVVKAGQTVKAGQLLGYEGATGRASGCHLHYGLFSPSEAASFAFDPVAAAHMLLPTEEIARVDPLLALPPFATAGIR